MKDKTKGFILGSIFSFVLLSVVVSATILYNAQEVSFTSKDSEWNVDNVEDAINDIKYNYMPNSKVESDFTPNTVVESDFTSNTIVESDYITKNDFKSIIKDIAHWEFNYTGTAQVFNVPIKGTYKLETWGAQGGTTKNLGGYGGYSVGEISLEKNTVLYVIVGGKGKSNASITNSGGYNGGGYSGSDSGGQSYGGGGATHIATENGLLSSLSSYAKNHNSPIIMVAGGGGGGVSVVSTLAGSGGGIQGNKGTSSNSSFNNSTYLPLGGTQTGPGFAYGGSSRQGKFGAGIQSNTSGWGGGGGSGYYGGSNGHGTSGAGGSGYIANTKLTNKAMYCYNCQTSSVEATKTETTTCTNASPKEKCSKQGDGYARITLVSID